jgi:hypothetical protein
MPEPPSLDGGRIGPAPLGITVLTEPHAVSVAGARAAASAGSIVRVLNLDLDLPAVSATAAADGSFQTSVLASAGNELRFEALRDGQRSAPADFLYTSEGGDQLTPSPRYDCLTLSPGFDVEVPPSGVATLQLSNQCSEPLTLAAPSFRSGGRFQLATPLPLVIAPAAAGQLELRVAGGTPGAVEDVLFLQTTLGAQTVRYPIGLFTTPP